ncbi:MAG: type III-B CRISPR module RAMP protein Cmr1 [Chloroflexi bacterium]|nr:type III-B CRISPR module RAMP protein Cmr1 [Chloroflexota bacterium]
MSPVPYEWRLHAESDLWTGSVKIEQRDSQPSERIVPDKLVTTGLLGSIRWWFEVLVRGLGGAACDPSGGGGNDRCPDQGGKHCVVCELFGCTGWARKFRFEVRDPSGAVVGDQIKRDAVFTLRFTPLRPILAEEWALLDLTLRLIANYGAIGGKTVLKPSDEANRMRLQHHLDYGIISVDGRPTVPHASRLELESYVRDPRWRKPPQTDFEWASLTTFWCVNDSYLARQDPSQSTFNRVLGRTEPKNQGQQLATNDRASRWLAGRQQESKKVFSFKNPPRTFGFVNPGVITFDQTKQRLTRAWVNFRPDDFVTGDVILARLTTQDGQIP